MTQREDGSIGSVAEEAVKLLKAVQSWAAEHGPDPHPGKLVPEDLVRALDGHRASGDAPCRYCPLCRLLVALWSTTPEVKHHVAVAASSLLQAGTALLDGHADRASEHSRTRGFEHIDLDVEGDG